MKFTPKNIWRFYVDGFRQMTLGKTLWAIILLKLFILFAILKLFFFPNLLGGKTSEEKAQHMMEQFTLPPSFVEQD